MRTPCTIIIWFGLVCLYIPPAMGQTDSKLTVEESIQRGLEYNYRLRAAGADAEEAEAAYRQVRSGRLPVVEAQASYMRLSDNIPEVDFSLPGTDTTYTLLPVELDQFHSEVSVRQLLFAGGRLNSQIEAAAHRADASGLLKEQEQADIAFEIRQAYWNLYQAQAALETVESALDMVDEHLREVNARAEEGTVLRTDLLSAETQRSEVLLDEIETRSTVRVARLELNRLIGLPAGTEAELVEPEQPGMISVEINDLVDQALEQRPGLQALTKQVEAQEAEVEATKAEWLPEISLVGRYIHARPNQYFFAEQDQFRGTWEAGVSLRWNIWAGGGKINETSRARARVKSAEAGLQDMKDQVTVEVTRSYLEMERAAEAIRAAAENIEFAEEAYRMAQMQFNEGVALSTHVMDAEYDYRTAQTRYTEAIADFEIAQASVLNSLGKIWGSDEH